MYLVEFAGEQAQKTKMRYGVCRKFTTCLLRNKNDVKKIETWTKFTVTQAKRKSGQCHFQWR